MTDDLHAKLNRHVRKQRAKKLATFVGSMIAFTAFSLALFEIMPRDSLGLRYIVAEVIDIQTIDDGKGDKRNIFVRYKGGQMMFQTDDLDFVDDIQGFVCVKEWKGVPVPKGATPRFQALAMPSDCSGMNPTE